MGILANLRLRSKFALVAALAFAMSVPPTLMAVQERVKRIHSARTEAAGLAPAGALLKLLRLTQQHRGLSAGMLAGNAESAAKRQPVQAEAGQALDRALAAVGALGSARLDAQAATLRTQWQPLAEAVAGRRIEGPASFARHTALISAQLDLLDAVVDESTLALEQEPAAHHAIAATLDHLPRLTEVLGQLRARGNVMLQQQSATPEDKARVEALASLAGLFQRDARHALVRMAETDATWASTLQAPVDTALRQAEASLALVDAALLKAQQAQHPAAAYFSRQTEAIDAQFALIDAAFAQLDQRLGERVAAAWRALVGLGVALAGLALLSLVLLVRVTRSTTRGIDAALQVARTVAAGNLSTRIETGGADETGELLQALKTMNDNLAGVVRQVRLGSEQIATGAGQIAGGNADLSQRTEEQAANLQQTAASMEQLGASVRHNAESAHQAADMARQASEVARQGGQAVADVVATMQQISEASRRIGDIIGVIDGIAFQTNILALNAAVEAARAGEQGRGFAVVAGEVRSLAQRSATAAREIKGLIHASAEQVETGARQVAGAGETMRRIVAQVERVDSLVGAIGESTQQQAQGIAQVGDAMNQLDHVTQQNAALVEESAAAADSMHQQAERLVQAVGAFTL